MMVRELFERCEQMVRATPTATVWRYLHETLVMTCAEALKDSRQAYGSLMAQTDLLCRRCGLGVADRMAVQTMRRHSNGRGEGLTVTDLRFDVRALALLISAAFQEDIPHGLATALPVMGRPTHLSLRTDERCLRCVVTSWDDTRVYATTDEGTVCIATDDETLRPLLTEGMRLNLLDIHREGETLRPQLIVVEPDFLLDISSLAACFTDYGHHPIAYTVGRLRPAVSSQPILLGNLAGTALDDIIHDSRCTEGDVLRHAFREQALPFCACEAFDAARFKADACQQVRNIREAVDVLFGLQGEEPETMRHDAAAALLEPSFVCEQLGLQGRVDLMTQDMRLLVEQKSGRCWPLERAAAQGDDGQRRYTEAHYVQLLLYYGVLRQNFRLSADRADIRLLYSRYPARQGLVVVNYYRQLFREAIRLRNRIVAQEMRVAREGFGILTPQLTADTLNEQGVRSPLFERYVRPETEQLLAPLAALQGEERDYVERMMTFVYREQLAQKLGIQEGRDRATAQLWNMPVTMKRDTGSLLIGLRLLRQERTTSHGGYDRLTFSIPDLKDDFLPNFRRNDMVCVYAYRDQPDVCSSILYKGVIERLTEREVTVRLNDGQRNPEVLKGVSCAIEPSFTDTGTTAAIRSLYAFAAAAPDRRALLLGRREPRADKARRLTRAYHNNYDDLLLRAMQAQDYFLLQGPPGTGKTSMALRFLVEECLASGDDLLLMAYTNRAVDEICESLTAADIDFLRLGSETACEPRFKDRLLHTVVDQNPRLESLRQRLADTRVVVSTTSLPASRPYLLRLKHFSRCIIDEASQILEPSIIGLLASPQIDRFILIGDHKQLPAVVQQPDDDPRLTDCRRSLFERLLRLEQDRGRQAFTGVLRRQGRMHPEVAAFPCEKFYASERLSAVPCPHQEEQRLDYNEPSADALDDLLKQRRVLFLPVDGPASGDGQPTDIAVSDKVNVSEARVVADLLRRLYRQVGAARFDVNRTVGVIVPYRNQIAMIRREIERLNIPVLLDITIDTVERYQGSQRDVIIYSFTIRHPYQLDFLTASCFVEPTATGPQVIDRKLNVVMTRARHQLLMTGYEPVLSANALFSELMARYRVPLSANTGFSPFRY